ncbi:hypothetical protein IJI72_02380 [Candidatus Saccharibacteria bacterium]|nr:hypothetical protein [Candidatus Saccharibacteria bacterium]
MSKKASIIDTLQLNKPQGIVPPMKNVVGGTYAETRSEIEARERAAAETEAALLAAREAKNAPAKKSSVWFAVLTVIFLLIALLGTGLGIYEYTKNLSLEESYNKLEEDYIELKNSADETRRLYDELVESLLAEAKTSEETPAETPQE